MNRLAVRLTVALVGVTLLTIALIAFPQVRNIAHDQEVLPPAERVRFTPVTVGRMVFVELGRRQEYALELVPAGRFGFGTSDPDRAESVERAVAADSQVAASSFFDFLQGSLVARTRNLVLSGSAALLLAVTLALLLARVIARPLEAVSMAAERVASGDLSVRLPVPEHEARLESETVRLSRSFNKMAESLERLERDRRESVADIAHELRTPLTVMRGRLEAIEDGLVRLDMDEVNGLHSQVLLLGRLVEDLRILSLADSGTLTLEPEPVDLADLAGQALASFRLRAREKHVELTLTAPRPVVATVDPERILQVLANLLDNAIRHAPFGGDVQLVVGCDASGPYLEVLDNGIGLPMGSEQRIFDRFYRVDGSGAREHGGSGLGLAIVNAIVALHKGTVTAANRATGGAVFRVSLTQMSVRAG